MSFLKEFIKRGYFHQCTNEEALDKDLNSKQITAYIGFDCTAKSLHVGNLMQIMILRLLQQYGHKPIILVGGATTKIGDPTGKEEARKYLSDEDILENMQGIKKSLAKYIKFGDGKSDAIMLNNSDWLEQIGYIEFLRKVGKHFSVNRMLTMDSVKLRLEREQSLTFLEFNYMLLQSYDFYHLNKEYGCSLQLGGSDQWGNIIMGVDLVRKMNSNESYGLTTPLLTTSSGVKMGKSINGAVWINEEQLSPYEFFQFWRNTEDNDVLKFTKLYCEFDDKKIDYFTNILIDNINEAKKIMAYEITKLCHGKEKADAALETAINIFEKGNIIGDLPIIEFDIARIKQNITASDLIFETGLTASKGEARKLIRGKGARINDEVIQSEEMVINESYIMDGLIKLSIGKKKHVLIKI